MAPLHSDLTLPARPARRFETQSAMLGWAAGLAFLIFGLVLSGMLATGAASPAPGAETQERSVKLFKVVTVKDEVVIGLTAEELKSLGTGPDLDLLAQRLASVGQITAWQYAVRKASDGALQQAPLQRVAILRSDAMRIEPYATPLPVVAPVPG